MRYDLLIIYFKDKIEPKVFSVLIEVEIRRLKLKSNLKVPFRFGSVLSLEDIIQRF